MASTGHTQKAHPFSIRLTDEENASLTARAGGAPLGTYARSVLLDEAAPGRRTRQTFQIKDSEALGRALGLLGQSRLASNLNQLAKAVHSGSLPVNDQTEADLRAACVDVRAIRLLLMHALGIKATDLAAPDMLAKVFRTQAGGAS